MSVQRENVQLVERAYEAMGRGDLAELVSIMAGDVEIHCPGPSVIPFAGTYRGHDGVALFASDVFESIDWDTREFAPREFVAEADQVVVLGDERLTAKPTGRSWAAEWAMVWTVREGKIARLREFHQTHAIASAFESESTGPLAAELEEAARTA
jgi:ketosteroid isomerase-like protein